jgi:transcriptional regulator with XRE-family HTH domain
MDAAALERPREGLPPAVRELAGRSGVSHNTITTLENRRRTANPRPCASSPRRSASSPES